MFDVVSTEYQEHASAIASIGTTILVTLWAKKFPVALAVSRNRKAHWQAKHSSATVATERPTMAVEIHESTRVMRGTSYTGRNDLNAQPNT